MSDQDPVPAQLVDALPVPDDVDLQPLPHGMTMRMPGKVLARPDRRVFVSLATAMVLLWLGFAFPFLRGFYASTDELLRSSDAVFVLVPGLAVLLPVLGMMLMRRLERLELSIGPRVLSMRKGIPGLARTDRIPLQPGDRVHFEQQGSAPGRLVLQRRNEQRIPLVEGIRDDRIGGFLALRIGQFLRPAEGVGTAPSQGESTRDEDSEHAAAAARQAASRSELLLPILLACAPAPPPADAAWLSLEGVGSSPTGRLIGWNLGRGTLYSPEAGPTHPEWRTPERAAAVQGLGGIRASGDRPLVRFSGLQIDGSAGGDGYHFEDFVRLDRTVSDDDNVAVYEYMAIVEEADAEPIVTVNFGSGTAAEAAAYARYLNSDDPDDPLVSARTAWGRTDPYDVRFFELGNESFAWWNTGWSDSYAYGYANPDADNGGDPDWFGRPSADAADFAARALTYVDAIAAVSPDARFLAPLSMANMQAWGGTDAAVPALRPLLEHPAVQAAVVHHYQVDDAFSLGVEGIDDPQLMVSGSALYTPLFEDLRGTLAGLDRDEPLQLALTEFHVAGFFAGQSFPFEDEAVLGLGIADMLIAYARWGIELAAQHLALDFDGSDEVLFEAWYNPYRADGDGGVRAMPTAQVTGLFADALRSRTLLPTVLQQPRQELDGAYSYDVVHAVAFADDAGSQLSLVALNRDLQDERLLRVELDGRWDVEQALVWAPDRWDQDALSDPVEVEALEVELARGHLELRLPPHALATVSLTAR